MGSDSVLAFIGGMLHEVSVFLSSEPMIYFVALVLLVGVVNIFIRIMKH